MIKGKILATTYKTYRQLVEEWVKVIKLNDIGFFIWPLFNDPDYRIDQFLQDKSLNKIIFKKKKIIHIHISFSNNPEYFDKNIIHTELLLSLKDNLGNKIDYSYGLIETLQFLELKHYLITFFIEGLDRQMYRGDYATIEEIYSIHKKLKNTSFLFFLQFPISISKLSKELNQRKIFTNIFNYQGVFNSKDSAQFIDYLQSKWDVKIDKKTSKDLVNNFGPNYGLIKNAIRILRFNKKISINQLINHIIIRERARIILSFIPKELILLIQKKEKISKQIFFKYKDFLEYLLDTKMIEKKDNIYYFQSSYYNNIEIQSLEGNKKEIIFITTNLSQKEEYVFSELKNMIDKVVSRERISEVMWGEEVDELYSEWAIDQTIHRLREKLNKNKLPYILKTKKGIGFILLNK